VQLSRRALLAGAAAWLKHSGFDRVLNLRGGLAAWADQVEPSMKRY
jgi:rhodanese-related sulfurtransferase